MEVRSRQWRRVRLHSHRTRSSTHLRLLSSRSLKRKLTNCAHITNGETDRLLPETVLHYANQTTTGRSMIAQPLRLREIESHSGQRQKPPIVGRPRHRNRRQVLAGLQSRVLRCIHRRFRYDRITETRLVTTPQSVEHTHCQHDQTRNRGHDHRNALWSTVHQRPRMVDMTVGVPQPNMAD